MKRTITLFLLLVCVCAHAQDYCFSVKDGHIIWQEVYETDLDSAAVMSILQSKGELTGITNTPLGVSCALVPHVVDYVGAGFTTMQASSMVIGSELEGHVVLQFREGRYRVTVDNLVFRRSMAFIGNGGEVPVRFEEFFLDRKGNIRRQVSTNHVDECVDYDLNKIFEIREAEDEKW